MVIVMIVASVRLTVTKTSTMTITHKIVYCITLYFRGRKISRKVNLKYFREKYFREFTVHAKISSRENIFPRKYLLAKMSRENMKISSRENRLPVSSAASFSLFAKMDTGITLDLEFASEQRNNGLIPTISNLDLADEKHSAQFFLNKFGWFDHVTNARCTDN